MTADERTLLHSIVAHARAVVSCAERLGDDALAPHHPTRAVLLDMRDMIRRLESLSDNAPSDSASHAGRATRTG